ncbi:MAG: branched-chain amino acid ABC transporter permease [Pelagibaca sp.]|nr:branched-chain amino acid ABC transporter permease [Pelagibaca sp.]
MEAYIFNLVNLIAIYAILAVTLNFIMGYAGIYSLAHAVFFGLGAYTSAWVAQNVHPSILLTIPAAMMASAALSLLLALPALRVRGEYFVAASLGLQVLAVTIFSEWKSFTGGIGGVLAIPPANVFGIEVFKPAHFAILSVVALVIVMALINALVHSSFGRNLRAIHDSESAAASFGKNVPMIKTISVVISAALAAVAGALYASYLSFINVESFTLDASVLVMAMVIIGGTGTVAGPIVGAALLMLLPSLISWFDFLPQTEIGALQQIIYGLGMTLLMIFRPGGIVGRRAKA